MTNPVSEYISNFSLQDYGQNIEVFHGAAEATTKANLFCQDRSVDTPAAPPDLATPVNLF